MALMEYCLVNIVLGDGTGKPKVTKGINIYNVQDTIKTSPDS